MPVTAPRVSTAASTVTARLAILTLFFLSGFAGLMYEVVWSRMVTYRFGATLDAVTTVLVAFMGGLALGAWLLGPVIDRSRRPLALYGWLEVAIAFSVALLPAALLLFVPVYRALVEAAPEAIALHRTVRFLLVVFMILIPTSAMGATLPALSRYLGQRRDRLGLDVGVLYSLNTLGAVAGAFFTGFFVIVALGVYGTLYTAVALNLAVGIAAIVCSKRFGEGSEPEASPLPDEKGKASLAVGAAPAQLARLTLVVYGLSGMLALAYQMVWFRALVFNFEYLKNTTYSFSAMLTVFLIGIGLGSAIMTRFVDKLERPYLAFALLQILIGAGGLFSFYSIHLNLGSAFLPFAPAADGSIDWWRLTIILFAQTGQALLIPTLAMGLLFPVAIRCFVGTLDNVGRDVGRLYAFNTVGGIVGATATSFFVIPAIGIGWTILALSFGSLLLGFVMLWRASELTPQGKLAYALIPALALGGVVVVRLPREFPIRMQRVPDYEKIVYYADGPLGTISVVENTKSERTIYVDNVGVAGTDPMLLTDQKSLAHVPMLFVPEPKRILTVGFGSGGASYSYSTYPMLEAIDCVEIDPTVVRAAHTMTLSNKGIVMPRVRLSGGRLGMPTTDDVPTDREYDLKRPLRSVHGWLGAWADMTAPASYSVEDFYTYDPRYRIILDDARSYLQGTKVQYDVIATDCTDLRYKTNANLYDLQYFRVCRERLTDDGLVVVWMPLGGLSREMYGVALRTFAEVFPEMAVWYMNNEPTHYCLLLGWKNPLRIDLDRMAERIAIPAVKRDLAELNLDSVEKILACYITDTRDFDLGPGQLNTENNPVLEFLTPRFGYNDEPILSNLAWMSEAQNDVMHHVAATPEVKAEWTARLKPWFDALPHILRGHEHYRRIETQDACREYMKAFAINPDDKAVKRMLDFPEIKLLAEADRGGMEWYQVELGLLYKTQKRDGEALQWLEPVIKLGAPLELGEDATDEARAGRETRLLIYQRAVAASARIYERNNQPERAAKLRAQLGDVEIEKLIPAED